jgi:hypothetical protein
MARIGCWFLVLALAVPCAPAAAQEPGATATVVGVVSDTISGRPLHVAVVRVAETGASTLTDEGGRFQIAVPSGVVHLEIRRIGYEPASLERTVSGPRVLRVDVALHPLAIGLPALTVSGRDEFARRLIARAIARKHAMYSKIHDYRFQAYVKLVVHNLDKHPDSASSVLLIAESHTSAYWEQPDHYQETILARRQSNNLKADMNMVSVDEIVNFGRDRIDLQKYSVVSPIADDALNHYDYRVLDTLSVNRRRVYRLAVEPRSESSPLFVGMIDIADSTYDVLGIDVGTNDAVHFNLMKDLRYRQRLKDVGGGRWMPYEIRFTGEVELGLPIPGLPTHMGFEHVAALDSFRFDEGKPPPDVSELRLVVRDLADHADSATWSAPGVVPLTAGERAAWAHIDSVEALPLDVRDWMRRGVGAAIRVSTDPEFFHYDRVEGAYVGAAHSWFERAGVGLRTKVGYAAGSAAWEYRLAGLVRVSEEQRLWVGGSYHDQVVHRPTLGALDYNPTYTALLWRLDPLDYYRDRGWIVTLDSKLFNFTELALHFNDLRQSSLGVTTDYSVFTTSSLQRSNPAIVSGQLRSLSGTLVYDSRPLLRSKGDDYYITQLTTTRITLSAEVTAPRLIASDFDFQRFALRIERRQRTLNLGLTTITAAAGIASGQVPPQRYFVVDFGMKAPIGVDFGLTPPVLQHGGFNTLDSNYAGTRAAMLTVQHDFDRLLFAKSGLPLVKRLPVTFSLDAGIFWTDFADHPAQPGDLLLHTARTPYSEVGFGLANLTPFLSPFDCAALFTWQLSSYPTNRFNFLFRVGLP